MKPEEAFRIANDLLYEQLENRDEMLLTMRLNIYEREVIKEALANYIHRLRKLLF